MEDILFFDDAFAGAKDRMGGKGANLGLLTQARFPVPPGFGITTSAYSNFLRTSGLDSQIAGMVGQLNEAVPERLEAASCQLRDLILQTPLPEALASEIQSAYSRLGADPYVAVRSSGTAEDLAEASFAGVYETYLDIKGIDALLDAVKRCWASMWTARAIAYRQKNHIDQSQILIAAVVQVMVPAEVSGVMFTGNPLNAATDETVINASWGLGEAVVQGLVTPDEYVLKSGPYGFRIRQRTLGSKELRIVRDSEAGATKTEEVPDPERLRYTLSDDQVVALATMGLRVTDYYDGLPQDIEWALADGQLYLLQSRPITGVEFSWDADVDSWQTCFPSNVQEMNHRLGRTATGVSGTLHNYAQSQQDDDDCLWTRKNSDEWWTGAKTPFFYSWRAGNNHLAISTPMKDLGLQDLAGTRQHKYYRGEVYYNAKLWTAYQARTTIPAFRDYFEILSLIPPQWHDEVKNAPFSWMKWLKGYSRVWAVSGKSGSIRSWLSVLDKYIESKAWEWDRALPELTQLSDSQLEAWVDRMIDWEKEYDEDVGTGFLLFAKDLFCLIHWILDNWYDGEVAFPDLLAGAVRRSATMVENQGLWELTEQIRSSETLLRTFREFEGASAFFSALETSEEGRAFLEEHRAFIRQHPHRGHSDRDIIFPRRGEDPAVDYPVFQSFLNIESTATPEEREREVDARREAAVENVVRNIRRKPLGFLKAEAFKAVISYCHEFNVYRDDERYSVDRLTYTTKLLVKEIARRLLERGLIETERDVYFLTRDELYAVLEGHANMRLAKAKVTARMKNFDLFDHKEVRPPLYLRHDLPVDFEAGETGDGALRGVPYSGGTVTATARVVKRLEEMGRVKAGEILICNATDPGWTPVFLVISGIVTETGGMLSHASCLSREYGLPCVAVPNAVQLIPDGATISVDGNTGEVRVINDGVESAPESGDSARQEVAVSSS